MSNSSIKSTDRILSGATTQGRSELMSDGNEGVLSLTIIFLVLYPEYS